jgi:hypothetical protein
VPSVAVKVRSLIVAQIVICVWNVVPFYYFISTAESVSREDAEAKLGYKVPSSWNRVFINHNQPSEWPFERSSAKYFALVLLSGIVALFVCEWRLYRLTPKGGLMYRMLVSPGRREEHLKKWFR